MGSRAESAWPTVIQGGMGVGVSGWRLARAVAVAGQLGVVSGVALNTLIARRLLLGDPGGHIRRALASFPYADVSEQILDRYFVEGGIDPGEPFRSTPRLSLHPSQWATDLVVAANFVEVFLAKEGHDGLVGVNYLEKLQMATPAATYGAMLAGVDCVLMGAGIPREIPGILDAFAEGREANEKLLDGPPSSEVPAMTFDPDQVPYGAKQLRRPAFLPIVSSDSLAAMLVRRSTGSVEGFVVEGSTAGGHNAPPRGKPVLDSIGQPVYGERDRADNQRMVDLGLPFWLAGGTGSPEALAAAREAGATGIQVGTLFAFARESGMEEGLRHQVLAAVREGGIDVRTDGRSSPTGYPFKVVQIDGSVAREDVYDSRPRVCDNGYLREPVVTPTGRLAYRCPAEPVAAYLAKGGDLTDTEARRCLCNGLLATAGYPQVQKDGTVEPPIVTSGDDLAHLADLLPSGGDDYGALDVVRYLTGAAPGL
jgi:NAD(P)H-dependent flavin oxidoreductase YrpB (nitropropane dioxygenase family)